MNSLSWFLYIVDISGGIQGFFIFLSVASLISFVVFIITGAALRDRSYRGYGNQEERTSLGIKFHKRSPLFFVPLIIFFLLAVAIPSKETLYLIGASQVGEQVVALQEVQEIGGDIGDLAKDAIKLLREKIKESVSDE